MTYRDVVPDEHQCRPQVISREEAEGLPEDECIFLVDEVALTVSDIGWRQGQEWVEPPRVGDRILLLWHPDFAAEVSE